MALGETIFDTKILRYVDELESQLSYQPAFKNFKDNLISYLSRHAEELATYTPEQLISQARSFEELVAMKDFLQERFGNEQSWWDFYHVRRKQLAFSVSYYGDNRFGLPVNPRIFDRGFGKGAQSEVIQRNLFAKIFTHEQLLGKTPLWSIGNGKIPVNFRQGLTFEPITHTERFVAFDLETTGLLKDIARRTTGAQRGLYSVGWITEKGIEGGGFLQRILPPRAKGRWSPDKAGTRPFFGHYIEKEIIPRGEKALQIFGDKVYRTKSEKEIVTKFIGALTTQPQGTALMGYGVERFDIPMMQLMAERHGMLKQWKTAIANRKVIDVSKPVQEFLSEQLAGKYVGWQESMFKEMGLKPRGWTLEAVAHAFGYQSPFGAVVHTPVTDAEMSAFVYKTLQDKQEALRIWKTGGFERYQKVLAEKGASLIPLTEFEQMLEERAGGVFLKPIPGVLSPSAYEEPVLQRLIKSYGAGPLKAAAEKGAVAEATRKISRTTQLGLKYGLVGAKYLGGAALLGAVLPGEGVSNLVGGAAAIGGWKAAGLGLARAKAVGGTGYKALAGALAYTAVKGIAAATESVRPMLQVPSYGSEGRAPEPEEAVRNMSQLVSQAGGVAAAVGSAGDGGVGILAAHKILGQIEADRQITEKETELLAALSAYGTQDNALLQAIEGKEAGKVFRSGISWKDKAHAGQITALLQEPNQLGDFGYYDPSRKLLSVGALIDPRDLGACLGSSHLTSDRAIEAQIVEHASWMTSPSKMAETTLHEGLHGVWDTDILPGHKEAFIKTAIEELEAGGGPNINALAAKHPVYARQIEKAKGNFLFGLNKEATEWVANEMFAHRGAAMRFNVEYNLGKDATLNAIVSQYVNWRKSKKQGGMSVFTGKDVDRALSAGGLTPAMYSHQASTARQRMTPGDSGILFDAFPSDGASKGVRNIFSDFGSPWQGPKVSGPVAAAIAGAGLLLVGGSAAALSSRDTLRPRTRVHGQNIAPEVMAFREEWIKDKEKRKELQKLKEEAYEPPGELEPWRIQGIGQGMAKVQTEGLQWHWEDADTLKLEYPWYKPWKDDISIRLVGVDAPELEHSDTPLAWTRWHQDQPYGQEALQELNKLVGDQSLDLVIAADPKERTYGRYLGLVHRPGADIPLNVEMVQKGIAAALPWGESGSDIFPREVFMEAEEEAVKAKKGMWQEDYWRRYLDIAQGARRRITFTSFSDLERLASNLHLAAAEALMRSEQNYEPWMGRYIGKKLRTVWPVGEGIHPKSEGIGAQSIRGGSDFGTGVVKGALKRIGKWFYDTRFFRDSIKKKVVESAATVKAARIVPYQWEEKDILADLTKQYLSDVRNKATSFRVFVETPHQKYIRVKVEQIIKEQTAFIKEKGITPRSARQTELKKKFELGKTGEQISEPIFWRIGPRGFPEPIKPPELVQPSLPVPFAAVQTRKPVTLVGIPRAAVSREAVPISSDIRQPISSAIPSRTIRMPIVSETKMSVLSKPMVPAKSGLERHDFPAMADTGVASNVRESLTEFKKEWASRWDMFKNIASKFLRQGTTTEEVLSAGTRIKSLGAGEWGEAFLHSVEYGGKEYRYVVKEARIPNHLRSTLSEKAALNESKQALEKEYQALSEIKGDIMPSAYYFDPEGSGKLYMEYMPGKTQLQMEAAGEIAPPIVWEEMRAQANVVASKGFKNLDVTRGNIMFDLESGRTSWLDFGKVRKTENTALAQTEMRKHIDVAEELATPMDELAHGTSLWGAPVKNPVSIPNPVTNSNIQKASKVSTVQLDNRAGRALAAQEKRLPSVAVPHVMAKDAGRRHRHSMSRRSW